MCAEKARKKFSRTAAALNATVLSLICVVFSIFLICRHWHTVTVYAILLIFAPFGVHVFAQFRRARRVADSIESVSTEGAMTIFDLLFWASLSNLLLLIYIAVLLKHLDGFL